MTENLPDLFIMFKSHVKNLKQSDFERRTEENGAWKTEFLYFKVSQGIWK